MNTNYDEIIRVAYTGFNTRKIDDVFGVMHPDVRWPKAFEGDYVTGREAVRDYWTRQWTEINPRVEPLAVVERPDKKIEVEVDQLVKDLDDNVLFDGRIKHIYMIENGLILSMEIEAV